MAVTIHDTPESYTPSDNPVTWTFSSTQTAQPNFYYEITVYINDVAVHEAQVFPESGIYSKYDASEWTSINTNRPVTTNNLTDDAENSCLVKIKVTERYGDPVADGSSSTASNVVAWKACMTNEDFDAWAAAAYVNDGVATGIKWLTNFPDSSIQKVGLTEHVRLMALTDETALNLTITLYDVDGNFITDYSFTYGAANRISIFNFAPSVIVSGTPILQDEMDECAYFIISEDGGLFESYQFDIDTSCKFSTYKRLHFMSLWGSIESLSYNLIARKSQTITSYGYKKFWGAWNGSAFEYNNADGTDLDFSKIIDFMLKVESDWLDEDVQNWLVENLHTSNLVFIETTAGVLQQRKITNASSEYFIQENDTLFQDVVTLKLPSLVNARL